ncbi:sulfite exporter TauE/SafE family protein [Moraxella ovis]|uniref:sulfite exporter TauE/SafE family protein n=1 Tax=Moraxella ovis TaxID=29433 RepID=UPI000DD6C300|nr:sulfite exporter TauE/SafE family protein [Moraxella ovis]
MHSSPSPPSVGTYSLSDAIILVLIPTAILNLSAWLIGGRGIVHNFCHYLVNYWQLVVLSLAGGMAGAYLLLWLNQAYLMILLALVVLWYAVTSLGRSPHRPQKYQDQHGHRRHLRQSRGRSNQCDGTHHNDVSTLHQ